MSILATSSQTFHSYFPLFDVDHLKIANCSLGNFGQALCIRSWHEDLILIRKSHNCSGIEFIRGDTAGGLKLIEQTLNTFTQNPLESFSDVSESHKTSANSSVQAYFRKFPDW